MNILFLITLGALAGVSVIGVKTHLKYRRAEVVANAYRNVYVITLNQIDARTGRENFKEVRQYVELIEEMR